MKQTLILVLAVITLSVFIASPIAAQTETGELPASDSVGLPDKEPDPVTTPAAQTQDTKVQDFVSGISVGAAVGFVGGAVIAWFLKPKPSVN